LPILSLFVIQAIILKSRPIIPWIRQPPPSPTAILLHNWFWQEWNKGIHGYITRLRNPGSFKFTVHPLNIPDLVNQHAPLTNNLPDPSTVRQHHSPSFCSEAENTNLCALLFSLSTPGVDNTYHFDSTIERICVDTGASASISTKRDNFITLKPVSDLKINGIGTGLPIEGIGILKWPLCDDHNNEIELFIKDA
jgi:hypothetical protein